MKMRKFLDYSFTLLVVLWIALQSFSTQPRVVKKTAKDLAQAISGQWDLLKKNNLIQGTIIIQQADTVLYSDGPVDKIYPVGSLSKSFVGYGFTEIEKRGLDLKTPVCVWIQVFCKEGLRRMTIQHLLDHQGGFDRDLSVWSFLKRSFNSTWSLNEIDSLELSNETLKFQPGTGFQYSNFGYLVLSRLWEIIEKGNFKDLVQITSERYGLSDTSAIQAKDSFPIYILVPFTDLKFPWTAQTVLHTAAGAGGIKSSAKDMMKWVNFYYAAPTKYSRGWMKSKNQNYQAYWHNGATLGTYTLMAMIPQTDLKVVLMIDNFKMSKQWSERAEQFEQYFY